jgi:hypothetical protein
MTLTGFNQKVMWSVASRKTGNTRTFQTTGIIDGD